MSALLAIALGVPFGADAPKSFAAFPVDIRGYWHTESAPCGKAQPGYLNVLDRAMLLETDDGGTFAEIEFGARRLRKVGGLEWLATGIWRENTIDSQNVPVRLSLSRDHQWLTVRLSGWRQRYARCPKIEG